MGSGLSNVQGVTNVNGTILFSASPFFGGINNGLYRTDGTTVFQITQSPGPISNLTAVGAQLYYVSNGALWRSDGANVFQVNSGFTSITNLTNVSGTLFYVTTPNTLWRTDGVTNTQVGSGFNFLGNLTNINGVLYFAGGTSPNGIELWRATTTGPPTQVADILPGTASPNPSDITNVN